MKSVNIPEIIRIASSLSVLIPLAFYLSKLKHAGKRLHIIGVLVLVSGVSDLVGFFLFRTGSSTVILFNSYYAALFLLLTWFYYEILFVNTRRVIVWVGLAIYLQSFVLVSLLVQSVFEYQTLMWVIAAIIMIVYSVAYFFYSFSSQPLANIFNYPFTWINTGVLVYFCLSLILFLLGNYILTELDPTISRLIWSFHNVSNLLKNIFFTIGIYLFRRKVPDFA